MGGAGQWGLVVQDKSDIPQAGNLCCPALLHDHVCAPLNQCFSLTLATLVLDGVELKKPPTRGVHSGSAASRALQGAPSESACIAGEEAAEVSRNNLGRGGCGESCTPAEAALP